jgi:hypothetical protein
MVVRPCNRILAKLTFVGGDEIPVPWLEMDNEMDAIGRNDMGTEKVFKAGGRAWE